MGIFQSHGRLARGLHFNTRRDALDDVLVGGGEGEHCGEGGDRGPAAEAPAAPRVRDPIDGAATACRPASAAVPAEVVARVAAAAAAAAAQPVHASLGCPQTRRAGNHSLLGALGDECGVGALRFEAALLGLGQLLLCSLSFALQPEGARRAAQIAYFAH